MNNFKTLPKKEKAEYKTLRALYPFFALLRNLEKSVKLFAAKCREITAGVLVFVMIFGMIPTVSLTVFAAGTQNITTWAELQDAINAGGDIKLTQDITAGDSDNHLNVPNGVTVSIDLNGYDINRNIADAVVDGYVIYVNDGGNLTVTDTSTSDVSNQGKITGGKSITDGGGVYNCGTFNINGGRIIGNTTNLSGGGVYNDCGILNLNGGSITGNSAHYGGGLTSFDGTFTMTGGDIRANHADNNGGGVDISTSSSFIMTGGSVTGNDCGGIGGGVYHSNGSFTVGGSATVTGNTAGNVADNVYLCFSLTLNVSSALSGEIGVTAHSTAYPVTVANAAAGHTLTAGDAAKITSDKGELGIGLSEGNVVLKERVITTWAELQAAINAGGSIKLTQNITAGDSDSYLNVPSGKTVNIDLNGHQINRNLASAVDNGCVIYIENGGNLTISDSSTADTTN